MKRETLKQNLHQYFISNPKEKELILEHFIHLADEIKLTVTWSGPPVICSLIKRLNSCVGSHYLVFDIPPDIRDVNRSSSLSPIHSCDPFTSSCPFITSIIHSLPPYRGTVTASPFKQMGQLTEPSLLVFIYITIKINWINTLGGRAISPIHSPSWPLPLTSENYCSTLLFAV